MEKGKHLRLVVAPARQAATVRPDRFRAVPEPIRQAAAPRVTAPTAAASHVASPRDTRPLSICLQRRVSRLVAPVAAIARAVAWVALLPVRLTAMVVHFLFRVGACTVLVFYYLRLAVLGVMMAALLALVLLGAGAFTWDHYMGGGLWYGPSKVRPTATHPKSEGASAPKARRLAEGAMSGV